MILSLLRHPRRALLAFATGVTLTSGAAFAACTGESLIDRLSPAQEQALANAIAATPFAEGLMWRAERDGSVVTLVGTLHIWDERIADIAQAAAKYMQDADLALFEMTNAEETRLASTIAGRPDLIRMPAGQNIESLMPPEVWREIKDILTARGISADMAAQFQPWFLANMVAIPTCAIAMMQQGLTGVDNALMAEAEARGIPTAALEPWDTVLTLLGGLTMEDQVTFLRLSLVAPEIQDALFVALLDGYFAGRIAEVWELNTIALDFMPDLAGEDDLDALFQTEMLDKRNHNWLPVITAAAEGHAHVFVAAGAAHLPGHEGLLALLEADGWTITRLD